MFHSFDIVHTILHAQAYETILGKKILQVKFAIHDKTSEPQQQKYKNLGLDYLPEVIHCGQSFEISSLCF